GTGPYDGRSGDNCDFPSCLARAPQLVTDSANDGRLWFVGINCGVNELKKVSMGGRTLDRHNPDPLMPNNDLVALVHIGKLNRSRSVVFLIKRNCTVDHC